MSEWKKVKLGECCYIGDGAHASLKREKEGILYITAKNISNNSIDYSNVSYISKETYNKHFKEKTNAITRPQKNDILYSIIGTIGGCILLKDETLGISSSIAIFRSKGSILSEYLYYYIKSSKFQTKIESIKGGVAQGFMSLSKLGTINIEYPSDEKKQKNIVSILSRYDSLIENYQKQIKLLEESAQRLYKEWFVNLRFPGHENTKIVDGVPEGWSYMHIKDICSLITSGGTPSRNNKDFWNNGNIKWVKTKELNDTWIIDTEEYITETGLNSSSAKLFPSNTVLMAIYASPTLGRLGILNHAACCNQAALGFIPNELISWQWLFYKLYELRDKFNSIARGAGQQNISAIVVKDTEIVVPDKNIIDKYTSIVTDILNQQKVIIYKIKLLTEARDRLLPKLMSGEIEV